MPDSKTPEVIDAIQQQLPAEHALLLAAFRAEFDSKLDAGLARLQTRILLFGIPLGAVGGFAAELVRPGSAAQALSLIPFV